MRAERGRGEFRWTPTNQQMVAWLTEQYPQVKTGKLAARAISETFPELEDVPFDCVPDGIVIDAEDRRIDLFEAEVTHPIPRSAMWAICDLWVACDNAGIALNLFVVNRYGHVNQMDIAPWYLALLQERTEQQPWPPEDVPIPPPKEPKPER